MSVRQAGLTAARKKPADDEVRYTVFGETAEKGTGTLTDFSGMALRFITDRALVAGSRIELSIKWPAPEGTTALRVVVQGIVTGFEDGYAAVAIQKYGS